MTKARRPYHATHNLAGMFSVHPKTVGKEAPMVKRLPSLLDGVVDIDQTPGPGRWILHAACAGLPTRYFFCDDPADTDLSLAVCRACPVQQDCGAYALTIPVIEGVWGGLTEGDRRRIRGCRECNPEVWPRTASQVGVPSPGAAREAPRCQR